MSDTVTPASSSGWEPVDVDIDWPDIGIMKELKDAVRKFAEATTLDELRSIAIEQLGNYRYLTDKGKDKFDTAWARAVMRIIKE